MNGLPIELGEYSILELETANILLKTLKNVLKEYGIELEYRNMCNANSGRINPTYYVILDEINFLKQNKEFTKETDKSDQETVSHPKHYCEGRKYEPKDVIRDWGLNFNTGSAVKYMSRAGRKGDIIEDLEKAKQFIQFEIDYLLQEKEMEKMNCAAEKIVNFLGDLKG